ncbi:MAG: type IV toxin-antitoxin system AbiEi family antitoxin domain-containing protein [Chloroflexota bacterium]
MPSPREKAEELLRLTGSARSHELLEQTGATRSELSRLVATGALTRPARGVYALPGYQPGEHRDLITVAKRAPGVVFCLLTALHFHELTTQAPFDVWIAIGNKAQPPRMDHPPLRVVRMSAATLDAGVDSHRVDATTLRVTSIAKTVADCFKFRNKVGLDVALEALREALGDKRVTMDDLWHFAKVDRVANIMRPYLEAVT